MNTPNSKALPTREISYNYCVAMFMAQQLEDGFRYLLDSGEYHGIIEEIELTPREKKKYKDSTELIDESTAGRLLIALKNRINLSSKHWKTLEAAIHDRNLMAHRFLVQFDYEGMTVEQEKKIIHTIYAAVLQLWQAVQIVRSLRKCLDGKTEQIDVYLNNLLKRAGVETKMPRRKMQQ